MPEHTRSWRELVADRDADAHDKMVDYIGHVVSLPHLQPRERELILFASSLAVRYRSSAVTHATRARQEGASDDQLFQAAALAALSSGFTSLIEGVEVLEELARSDDG